MIEAIPAARMKFNALDANAKGRILATCAGYITQHPEGKVFSFLYNQLTDEERDIVDGQLNALIAEGTNTKRGTL